LVDLAGWSQLRSQWPLVGKIHVRADVGESENTRHNWTLRTSLGHVALSFLDQAAYGLSTFLVTAVVSRSSTAPDFARFMLLWTMSWTICALSTELLVTPLRIALPRGELSSGVIANLQSFSFVVALSGTVSAVLAVALGHEAGATVLGALAIVSSGLSFFLRRAVLYTNASVFAAVVNSMMNLMITILLLVSIRVLEQSAARWGQVVAALALVLPLTTTLRARLPRRWRIGPLLLRLSRSGIWLATGVGLRGLVCSSGLLALVAHTDGLQSAAALGQTFVLASPVQLASSSLPLLLLPGLVRSSALGRDTFRRTLLRQLCMYLLCALIGLIALFVLFDWWRRLLVPQPGAVAASYPPVALFVVGLLLSSWSGSALQAVRSPPYLFVATVVAAAAVPIGVTFHIQPPYMASLPYAFSILTEVALTITSPMGSSFPHREGKIGDT
jgi:hypothetical protein